MTARSSRMDAAAALTTSPATSPAVRGSVRTKPYRITIDLEPETYAALHQWLASAAGTVGTPKLTLSDAVRAMVEGTISDTAATGVILDLLRRGESA